MDNWIIQPEFMKEKGTMCMTELWTLKKKKEFARRMDETQFRQLNLTGLSKTINMNGVGLYQPRKIRKDLRMKRELETPLKVKLEKYRFKARQELSRSSSKPKIETNTPTPTDNLQKLPIHNN